MNVRQILDLPTSLITSLVHYSGEPETAKAVVRFYCLRMLGSYYAKMGGSDSTVKVHNPYSDDHAECRVVLADLDETLTLFTKIGALPVDLDQIDEDTCREINTYKRQMIIELADMIR